MQKYLLISIVLIIIISGIIIAGCGDSGSSQIVLTATGTPTQIANLITIKGQALELNGPPPVECFCCLCKSGIVCFSFDSVRSNGKLYIQQSSFGNL